MSFIKQFQSLFNKAKSEELNVHIDTELISNWISYAKQLGLTENETLGMAYLNAAIPTVVVIAKEDVSVISPLQKVVSNYLSTSSEGANVITIYREFYFNASIRCQDLEHITFKGLREDFYSIKNNKYLQYTDQEETIFSNSGLTLDFIGNVGKILFEYKINILQAFNLGHIHTNYLLSINFNAASGAVIYSNVLPEYLASLVECIPKPNSLATRSDLWLFSKLLMSELGNTGYDQEFQAWIWYYHNSLFYIDKPGSVEIKKEWDLENCDFESIMLNKIYQTIVLYYKSNRKIGKQSINRKVDLLKKPEDLFIFLNDRMQEMHSIEISRKNFRNIGEKTNYLCRVFILAIEVSFDKFNFDEL